MQENDDAAAAQQDERQPRVIGCVRQTPHGQLEACGAAPQLSAQLCAARQCRCGRAWAGGRRTDGDGAAKVDERPAVARRLPHDVAGLEVAVHQARSVQPLQLLRDVQQHKDGCGQVGRHALHPLVQSLHLRHGAECMHSTARSRIMMQ